MWRSWVEQRVRRAWQGRGPLARALWPLSCVYAALWQRQQDRRAGQGAPAPVRLPVPVLVVGNVVAGGAGKTPTTLALVQHLQSRGWRPGIISRGYGRAGRDCREVLPHDDPRHTGDEPLLLRRRAQVPVFVAPQRADAGQALLAAHPAVNVLVCDDGLQHRALARDVEICVFDARGVGNGWLLPAGPLREPWPRPVDLLLCTEGQGGDAPSAVPAPPGVPVFQARRRLADHALRADGSAVPLASLRGQPLAALAAIARPEAFFDMLRAQGLTLAHCLPLPDHADLSRVPLPAQPPVLLCTEKDAVKLWPHQAQALAVPLVLEVPAMFWQAVDEKLARRTPPSTCPPSSPPSVPPSAPPAPAA